MLNVKDIKKKRLLSIGIYEYLFSFFGVFNQSDLNTTIKFKSKKRNGYKKTTTFFDEKL